MVADGRGTGRGPARALFDLWSRVYDQPLVQRLVYRPVHDAVVAALADREPDAVLDVGCGTGLLAARMAWEHGCAVVGCDFSGGMLQRARARSRRPAWVQADALRLPFRDGAFDAVCATESFHWLPDQAAAMREFHRVLRPGGLLLVALVNPLAAPLGQAAHSLSRLAGQPFYWPTRGEVRRMAVAAGFTVTAQQRVTRLPGGPTFPAVLTVAAA